MQPSCVLARAASNLMAASCRHSLKPTGVPQQAHPDMWQQGCAMQAAPSAFFEVPHSSESRKAAPWGCLHKSPGICCRPGMRAGSSADVCELSDGAGMAASSRSRAKMASQSSSRAGSACCCGPVCSAGRPQSMSGISGKQHMLLQASRPSDRQSMLSSWSRANRTEHGPP